MLISEVLVQEPFFLLLGAIVLGLTVGSFLNVLIFRLPARMEDELEAACLEHAGTEVPSNNSSQWFGLKFIITPPSNCPTCAHRLSAWENIPLLSYIVQRGHCKSCNTLISPQYPLIEALSAVLSFVVVWRFGLSWSSLAALLLTWAFLTMSVIDIRHHLLPDVLILPLIWLGLMVNLGGMFTDIHSAIYGAVGGYLSLWFIFHLFLLFTGKEGMGYGDFKLFALFGAWLGWQFLPQILLLSTVIGAIIGVAMISLRGRDKNIPIPFGPYLATAGWVALLWGEEINRSYLQMTGIG